MVVTGQFDVRSTIRFQGVDGFTVEDNVRLSTVLHAQVVPVLERMLQLLLAEYFLFFLFPGTGPMRAFHIASDFLAVLVIALQVLIQLLFQFG